MRLVTAANCTTAYVGVRVYYVTRQGSSQSKSSHPSFPKPGNAPSASWDRNVESDGNGMFPTSIAVPEHQSGGGIVRLTSRIQNSC